MYENRRTGLLFVLPFLLGVLGFKLFPFVASLALSMTQFDVMSPPEFVGLENYRVLATQDPTFRQSLKVTLLFVVLAVPLRVAFALGIAQVLNFRLRGVSFFRAAFYLPSILGGSIAVAVLWRFIFSQNGLVNIALAKIGVAPVMWLADERYSIWTIVTLFTWQFGSSMVVFLAALQNIPKSLYEAADMDGASRFQQFWRIMQLVHGFQEFNGPYMVTEGGPLNSTYLLSLYIYEESFRYFNLGYGSALSWVMFALVGGFSALSFWSSKYWVFYAGEKEGRR